VARLEDGALVFNALTWETHLLNLEAMAVLEILEEAAKAERELVDALLEGQAVDSASRANYAAQVRSALIDLESLGLVAPDAPIS